MDQQFAYERVKPLISCVIPVFNEEEVIQSFINQLSATLVQLKHDYEIIIVDDGSQDRTVNKIIELRLDCIKILSLSRNFGKEAALTAGIEHAKGDAVILMDGDFQHPISLLPDLINHWVNGYDMVYGIRQNRMKESYLKTSFTKIFYWVMRKITKINIPAHAGDFRLLDKRMVQALLRLPERTRYMKGLYAWIGYKSIGIPYEASVRGGGKTSWGFRKLAELAITGITSFSDLPLRVWGFIGFLISSLALCYAIYIITVTLIFGADLPGFPTTIVAIMFLGGIQLLSIGILGEYIARIFTEVKQRPQYLVQRRVGFDNE